MNPVFSNCAAVFGNSPLCQTIARINDNFGQLDSLMQQLEDLIKGLDMDTASRDAEVQRLQNEITELRGQLDQERQTARTARDELEQLQAEKGEIQSQLARQTEQGSAAAAEIAGLRGNLEAVQAETVAAQQELEEAKTNIQALQRDLESAKQEQDQQISKISENETTIRQLEQQLEQYRQLEPALQTINVNLDTLRNRAQGMTRLRGQPSIPLGGESEFVQSGEFVANVPTGVRRPVRRGGGMSRSDQLAAAEAQRLLSRNPLQPRR